MPAGTAFSRKTESVLNRLVANATNLEKQAAGTAKMKALGRSQVGGYFANMDKATYQLLMIWNGTEQPKDRQEFTHHLLIHQIAVKPWFSENDYNNAPEFRNRVNALIDVALHNLTHAKRLTQTTQRDRLGVTKHYFKAQWEPRLLEIEAYLHQLLNQAAQHIHKNS